MEFIKIRINNFQSYKEAEFTLDGQGLCGVVGSNGAGKSSILKAIAFVLFGIGTDDVINRQIGNNTSVELVGYHSNSSFRISRYRRHEKYKNNIFFFINDELVKSPTNTETQKKIEQFLGIDYKTFTNITSFSSEALLFASADDASRKAIFEKILQNLEIYNSYLYKTKEKQKELSDKILKTKHQIDLLKKEQTVISNLAEGEKKRADSFEDSRKLELSRLFKKKKGIEDKLQQVKKVESKLERYLRAEDKLWQYNDSFVQQNTRKLEAEKEVLEDRKEFLLETEKCPTCLQNISTKYKSKALTLVEEKLSSISPKIEECKRVDAVVAKLNKQFSLYIELKNKMQFQLDRVEYLTPELGEINEEIQEAEEKQNTHMENYSSLSAKSLQLRKLIKKNIRELGALDEEALYLVEISKAFSKTGIPNTIISRTLSYLENRTNHYLSILSEDSLSLEITGQTATKAGALRNKIGINIISNSGAIDFNVFSGGERQRINIALLLGLRDVALISKGLNMNCLFLDEVLDLSLDVEGIENTLNLLQSVKSKIGSIFIFSPKETLITNTTTSFDNIYNVNKDYNGFSQISRR